MHKCSWWWGNITDFFWPESLWRKNKILTNSVTVWFATLIKSGIISTHPLTSLPEAVLKIKEGTWDGSAPYVFRVMEIIQWCELTRNRLKKGFLMYLLYWKSKWWFNSQEKYYKFALHIGPFVYVCLGWWHCSCDLSTPAKCLFMDLCWVRHH